MSPSWVNGKLDLLKVSINCSSNQFYGDFHPCSTFIMFGLVRRKTRCVYYWSLKHSIIQLSSVSYCRKCALCRYSPLTCRIYYRRQNHYKTKELGCFRQLLGNHVSWLMVMAKSRFPFVYGENLEDVLRTEKSLKNRGFKVFRTNFGKFNIFQ